MSSTGKARAELVFTIVILISTVVFVFYSFGLSNLSRRFPLIVCVFMILLLVVRITQIAKTLRSMAGKSEEDKSLEARKFSPWRKAYPAILWLAGLLACFYVLGIVLGSVVFTFCFVRFFGKESTMTSVLSTLVVVALVYGLFGVAMKFPLYGGIIQLRMPGTLLG